MSKLSINLPHYSVINIIYDVRTSKSSYWIVDTILYLVQISISYLVALNCVISVNELAML